MTRKNTLFAVCTILSSMIFAASARATTISFATTTPVASTLTDWTSSLSFPQFNPALGTLSSVELDLSGSFQTTITVSNTGTSASSGTVKTEVQYTVQDAGNNLFVPSPDLLGPVFGYSLGVGGNTISPLLDAEEHPTTNCTPPLPS